MSGNGTLPASDLAPIPGGHLRRDAAAAYNAMNAESVRRGWGTLTVTDSYRPLGHPGDYARGVWSQWAAWERHQHGGALAAYPGTSNHGYGLAVDVPRHVRWVIDQIGAKYGFSKSWSDAQSEWWHILYQPGHYHGRAFQVVRYGSHGKRVRYVQKRLRKHGYHSVRVTGFFGKRTRRAVALLQRAHHLQPDGVVGPVTWKILT